MRRIDPFIAVCLVGTIAVIVLAAPAPKPTPPDTLGGVIQHAGPTVETTNEQGESVKVWLVFPSQIIEQETHKIESGQPVKFHGRSMAGGTWRYFVVESIAK